MDKKEIIEVVDELLRKLQNSADGEKLESHKNELLLEVESEALNLLNEIHDFRAIVIPIFKSSKIVISFDEMRHSVVVLGGCDPESKVDNDELVSEKEIVVVIDRLIKATGNDEESEESEESEDLFVENLKAVSDFYDMVNKLKSLKGFLAEMRGVKFEYVSEELRLKLEERLNR